MAAGLHTESLDGWFLFPTRAEISRFSTVSTPAVRSNSLVSVLPHCVHTGTAVHRASCRFVFTVSTPALQSNQPRVSSSPLCPHRHCGAISLVSVRLHCVDTGTAVKPASCQFSTVSTPALRSSQPHVS
jgi:hypothetical protein